MNAPRHGPAPAEHFATALHTQVVGDAAGFSSSTWDVLRATLADYRSGEGARARARLGFSTPPEASRRVWVRAGASPFDLRLACEVLAVLRERRKDMQLVLTFERDDRDVMTRFLAPDRKLVLGWGPADWPPATRRFLRRFAPIGVVSVGTAAHSHNLAASGVPLAVLDSGDAIEDLARRRRAAVGASSRDAIGHDRYWSVTGAVTGHRAEDGGLIPGGEHVTGSARVHWRWADPRARFVEAQADTTLAAILGDAQRPTWLALVPVSHAKAVAEAFRSHALARESTLLLAVLPESPGGPSKPDVQTATERWGASFARWISTSRPDGLTPLQTPPPAAAAPGDARASQWLRSPLAPGAVLWLDATEWLAAAATAAQAVAWQRPAEASAAWALDGALWPVLAAGRSCWQVGSGPENPNVPLERPSQQSSPRFGVAGLRALDAAHTSVDTIGSTTDWSSLFDHWAAARASGQLTGFAWRRAGDTIRQAFWAARRAVDQDFSELQDWVWQL